jgi:glycosyltransferase involved in cell wall biosynthesis
MRICQAAPLIESVPPKGYGGTERVVYWLTEELVKRGHEVTLFASTDSQTSARLEPMHTSCLRLQNCIDYVAHHVVLLERLFEQRRRFDVIHSHLEYLMFPWIRHFDLPAVSTMHNSMDVEDLLPVMREFPDVPLISISEAHRRNHLNMNWLATIYHGMPRDLFKPNYTPGDYLLFLGRFSPEKRPHLAIEIARKAERPIKLAAKLEKTSARDMAYFKDYVEPLLSEPGVEYVGEVSDQAKADLLSGARALLFPIEWPEPFGLVMIEAMASGTPVIAFPYGSVPEIIEHGKTGFLCDGLDAAAAAVGRLDAISRETCRQEFERRFSVETMADQYLQAYERLLSGRRFATQRATEQRIAS